MNIGEHSVQINQAQMPKSDRKHGDYKELKEKKKKEREDLLEGHGDKSQDQRANWASRLGMQEAESFVSSESPKAQGAIIFPVLP